MNWLQMLMILPPLVWGKVGGPEDKPTQSEWPVLSGEYLGQEPPGTQPRLFAEGIIPVEGIQHCFPAFSPDGMECFWMTVVFDNDKPRGEIWHMQEADGHWTQPALAPFSGKYNDHAPVFSPDGTRLYFSSSRPGGIGQGKDIWFVEKMGRGWTEPEHLGSPPNTEVGATQATFTNDGTVYFVGSFEGTQWNTAIYRSRLVNGQYEEPELLGEPIGTAGADTYPFIAPDESYLLFASSRLGRRSPETDLYVSFRNADGTWAKPVHMDSSVNNGMTVSFSFITYDGKYLFFNRFDHDGTDKFYWMDAAVIQRLNPDNDQRNKPQSEK